ncbi:MAG: nitrilase-related carbon-nitrogen hydrolase, partial [Gemmatimonadales bacterium]
MPRLAIAQFRPTKGAYAENLARVGALFRELGGWPEPPDIVLFPEAALTGYFLEGGVRELAVEASRLFADLSAQHHEAGAPPFDVAIGFYELHENQLNNSALYATLGGADAGIRHVHRKVFLPTYGVFDEERFVEAGKTVRAFDTRFGRTAMLVCEDAWHSLMPTLAALDGAQTLLIPSATPARGLDPGAGADGRPGNLERWERLAQGIAEEHGVYVAVAQLVGFEGGKAFAGGSVLLGPRGEPVLRGPVFEPAVLAATLDPQEIARARAEAPLLSDLEHRLPHLLEGRRAGGSEGRTGTGKGKASLAHPSIRPSDAPSL